MLNGMWQYIRVRVIFRLTSAIVMFFSNNLPAKFHTNATFSRD